MTIDPYDDYGERLRRVLHAEVDSIVPSGDGLERIRARVEKRRMRRAFLSTWWMKPVLAAVGAVAVAGSAAVAAPLLQQVGGERLSAPPAVPQAPGAPAPGQTSAGGSPTPTETDGGGETTSEPSATAAEPGGPATVVKCYPASSGKPEKGAKSAQPSQPSAKPSASNTPSAGPSCAPGSTPTATITPTTSPPDCEPASEGCPSVTPTEPSTEPSP